MTDIVKLRAELAAIETESRVLALLADLHSLDARRHNRILDAFDDLQERLDRLQVQLP